MDPSKWIMTRGPLTCLWDQSGNDLPATKIRDLDRDVIRDLLRSGPIQFVVANIGSPLTWIPLEHRYDFWKNEASPHLWRSDQPYLENYPGEYFYFASEWRFDIGDVVILLEMAH